jgi:hypothetical protein
MRQDDRLDFDAMENSNATGDALLRDIEEATKRARQRKADDAAIDAKSAKAGKDKLLMYAIICIAAIILLFIAYKVVFKPDAGPVTPGSKGGFVPVQGNPRPAPYRPPVNTYVRPKPQAPPSEPVRRNPSETYDEGSGNGL